MNKMFYYLVSHFFSLSSVKCHPCTLRLHALQDVNGCNEITYTEFIAATLDLHGRVEEKRLAEAFDLMDDDDSGYISKEVCGVVTNQLLFKSVALMNNSHIFSQRI